MNLSLKFISYSGDYPNLCRGVLTICDTISGKTYSLSHVLKTGGSCRYDPETHECWTEEGPWTICKNSLPSALQPYVDDITEIVNANIPHGCCGGCL